MSDDLLRAETIVQAHDRAIASWRTEPPADVAPGEDLASLVLALHFSNFALWNLEDEARRRDKGDAYVVAQKRAIDTRNQKRSDLIERIDERILGSLAKTGAPAGGMQHSETAGMIIDRLSILALKIRNMSLHAARDDDPKLAAECARKRDVLEQQRRDLAACLDRLIDDCRAGRRHFKVYRQFKAYNDPSLSPDRLA
jgi:hypothetical protein